jgi:hypothetical protein
MPPPTTQDAFFREVALSNQAFVDHQTAR